RCGRGSLTVFDSVDLVYGRSAREARLSGEPNGLRSAALTRQEELAVVEAADVTIAISGHERAILEQELPGRSIKVISDIHSANTTAVDFEARRDLFFVGGYGHPPNVDAVQWFARDIWPTVRHRLPGVKAFLIGSEMH